MTDRPHRNLSHPSSPLLQNLPQFTSLRGNTAPLPNISKELDDAESSVSDILISESDEFLPEAPQTEHVAVPPPLPPSVLAVSSEKPAVSVAESPNNPDATQRLQIDATFTDLKLELEDSQELPFSKEEPEPENQAFSTSSTENLLELTPLEELARESIDFESCSISLHQNSQLPSSLTPLPAIPVLQKPLLSQNPSPWAKILCANIEELEKSTDPDTAAVNVFALAIWATHVGDLETASAAIAHAKRLAPKSFIPEYIRQVIATSNGDSQEIFAALQDTEDPCALSITAHQALRTGQNIEANSFAAGACRTADFDLSATFSALIASWRSGTPGLATNAIISALPHLSSSPLKRALYLEAARNTDDPSRTQSVLIEALHRHPEDSHLRAISEVYAFRYNRLAQYNRVLASMRLSLETHKSQRRLGLEQRILTCHSIEATSDERYEALESALPLASREVDAPYLLPALLEFGSRLSVETLREAQRLSDNDPVFWYRCALFVSREHRPALLRIVTDQVAKLPQADKLYALPSLARSQLGAHQVNIQQSFALEVKELEEKLATAQGLQAKRLRNELAEKIYAIADAYEHIPGHEESSIDWYERVLDVDPKNLSALDALDHLTEQDNRSKMTRHLRAATAYADEQDPAVTLLVETAALSNLALGDRENTIRLLARALSIEPGNTYVLSRLQNLLDEDATPALRFDLETRLAQVTPDNFNRAAHLLEAARLLEKHKSAINKPIHPIQLYLEALDAEPSSVAAMDSLIRTAAKLGMPPSPALASASIAHPLTALLVAEAQAASGQEEAAAKLLESWLDVLDAPALEFLAELEQQTNRYENLLNTLNRRILFENPEETQLQRIELYTLYLNRPMLARASVASLKEIQSPALEVWRQIYCPPETPQEYSSSIISLAEAASRLQIRRVHLPRPLQKPPAHTAALNQASQLLKNENWPELIDLLLNQPLPQGLAGLPGADDVAKAIINAKIAPAKSHGLTYEPPEGSALEIVRARRKSWVRNDIEEFVRHSERLAKFAAAPHFGGSTPELARVALHAAACLIEQKDPNRFLDMLCRSAAQTDPPICFATPGIYSQTARALERQKEGGSISFLQDVTSSPDAQLRLWAMERLAELLRRQGHKREALTWDQRICEVDPRNVRAFTSLTLTDNQRSAWLRHALDYTKSKTLRLLLTTRLARQLHQEGEINTEALSRQLLEQEPSWLWARHDLGRTLFREKRWNELGNLYKHELSLFDESDPARARILLKYAELLEFDLDNPEAALPIYQEALSFEATARPARAGYEACLLKTGRYAELALSLETITDKDETPTEAAARLCRCAENWLTANEPQKAIDCYAQALKLVKGYPYARVTYEYLLWQTGRTSEVLDLYRSEAPYNPESNYKLAVLEATPDEECLERLRKVDSTEALFQILRRAALLDSRELSEAFFELAMLPEIRAMHEENLSALIARESILCLPRPGENTRDTDSQTMTDQNLNIWPQAWMRFASIDPDPLNRAFAAILAIESAITAGQDTTEPMKLLTRLPLTQQLAKLITPLIETL